MIAMETVFDLPLSKHRHTGRFTLGIALALAISGTAQAYDSTSVDNESEMLIDAAVADSGTPLEDNLEAAPSDPEISGFDTSRDTDIYTDTDIDYTELNIQTPAETTKFEALQQATKHFAELFKAKIEWPIFEPGPVLQLGDRHPQVAQLRARLLEQGDLAEESFQSIDPTYFDDSLALALSHFQTRYGLTADGVFGAGTRQVLNVPIDIRMREIEQNVAWQKEFTKKVAKDKEYLHINIPSHTLEYMVDGKRKMRLDVRVGSAKNPTKEQSGLVEQLSLNPPWTIPEQYAFKRIIPKAIDDRRYLDRQGIQVVAAGGAVIPSELVEWYDLYNGANPLKLRLKPGRNNPLGRYLIRYASGSGYLTAKKRGAASNSAAVEVDDIDTLSMALLQHSALNARQLRHLPNSPKTRNIDLKKPVPVHVTYFTTEVDDKGVLRFHKDIYSRFKDLE